MKNYSISAKKQKELFKKYPVLFEYALPSYKGKGDHPITKFHIECWKGWLELIEKLSEEIAAIDIDKTVRVTQIKQKFAGLRYYIRGLSKDSSYKEEIQKLLQKYESCSYEVCEACGKPGGRVREKDTGYILTVCDACLKKEDFKEYTRQKNIKPLIVEIPRTRGNHDHYVD
jgi:hypothetical protein